MKASWRTISCSAALLPFILHSALYGEHRSKSSDLAIVRASDLPEQARLPADSIFLYWGSNSTYLYVEQQQGARLIVLDVTDPGKIKVVTSTALNAPGPFDFVRQLDGRSELIRFRNGGGFAVLDLKKARSPELRTFGDLPRTRFEEPLGGQGLLLASASAADFNPLPHDFQVVDTSKPSSYAVVATVRQVVQRVVDSYTGTTFLLGSDGLTIIRRTSVEDAVRAQLSYN
jgi:hypothetical protein